MKASKTFGRYFMEQLGVFKGLVFSLLIVGVFVLSSGVFSYALTIGHEILPGETSFTNSDTISAEKGDDAAVSGVWGVYSNHTLELFENTETGAISALGQVGDAVSGDAGVDDILGVLIEGSAATFTNAGEISADAVAGDASGDGFIVEVSDVAGAAFLGGAGSVTNSGTISASATAGSAIGDDSYVEVYDVYGVSIGGDVDSFTNTGAISAGAQAGNISGSAAAVAGGGAWDWADTGAEVYNIYGTYFYDVGSFTNSGTISASACSGM